MLRSHHTTVWAQLVVTRGTVTFIDEAADPGALAGSTVVSPHEPHTIIPHRPHHIVPSDDAEFHVQFYEPVDE